jgi:hypothetical protein
MKKINMPEKRGFHLENEGGKWTYLNLVAINQIRKL